MAAEQAWALHDDIATASYLQFLTEGDPLVPDFLDTQTLTAVCKTDPEFAPPAADEATRKRIAADDSDSEDDARQGKRTKSDAAASSKDREAARTKACREKARREKINERFAELATLMDPTGEPKSDKPSILADAIKHLQQLRVENHQLKQLNKFLEERVAQYERDRGQQLYQQSLMLQHGGLLPGLMQHGLHMPPGSLAGLPSTSSMPGPSGASSSAPAPLMLPLHAAAAAHAAAHAAAQQAAGPSATPTASQPALPSTSAAPVAGPTALAESYAAMAAALAGRSHSHPGPSCTPPPSAGLHTSTSGALPDAAAAAAAAAAGVHRASSVTSGPGSGLDTAAAAMAAAAGPGGKGLLLGMGLPPPGSAHAGPLVPQQHWVPPNMLDSKKDSLLRPPAA